MNTKQAIAQLDGLNKKTREAMRKGEARFANVVVQEAKSRAPGSLPNKIGYLQANNVTDIIGGDELSAYVEFGTGEFAAAYVASLPKEAQDEARKFFVNGKGKGNPQPFFFPSIFANQEKLLQFIDDELGKLEK